MSISRDNIFYSDIQTLLEKKLPEHGYPVSPDLIREILGDLFDSVALHVWSRADVVGIANRRGYPISSEATDEILSNIERHVDCELGITWQTIEIAVNNFYSEVGWWKLSKEQRQSYHGDFVLKSTDNETLPVPDELAEYFFQQSKYVFLKNKSMQEAFEIAEKILLERDLILTLYALPPESCSEELTPAEIEEQGREICDIYPDDFGEEDE